MVFTSDMVQILPGYPKQSSDDPSITLLAFYLQLPQGSSDNIVNKDALTAIVESDMSRIGTSMGGTILSVQPLSTNRDITAEENDDKSKAAFTIVILGAIGAAVSFLVVVVALMFAYKRRER